MAIGDHTLNLAGGLTVTIDAHVGVVEARIVEAWARAWAELQNEWREVAMDLAAVHAATGAWPSRAAILRARRVRAALADTQEAIEDVVSHIGGTVRTATTRLGEDAARFQADIIASQLPDDTTPGWVPGALEVTGYDRDAVTRIVERSTEQITSLMLPLPAQAAAAVKALLVKGVSLGDNPRTVARSIETRVGGALDGYRNRALVIARTEMLDVHREVAAMVEHDNKDLVTEWVWVASLDRRTCPSCLAMHGTRHPIAETGPDDHQQGRCARVTKTRSWRDLGFDVDEPDDMIPDARAWFDSQPPAVRAAMFGRDRVKLLDSGAVGWEDLATRRTTSGWRDSYVPTPVSVLAGRAR